MRHMRGTTHRTNPLVVVALLATATTLGACGGDDTESADDGAQPAPAASQYPAPDGGSLDDLLADAPASDLVVSPAGAMFTEGRNRFGFGVFEIDQQQVTDAEVAIYAAPAPANEPVQGPFPARIESLETEPEFTARTTADDPDAAKVVYVTDLALDRSGEWRLIALVRTDDGLRAARVTPSIVVERSDPIPAPGEPAPSVHTPTTEDVGDVAEIDTRVPHDTMHDQDLADVLGDKPVVLLFATPALCISRVCGPVVDVAEQLKAKYGDDVAFIHMEIYQDNDPNKHLREQVAAYGLQTEPWVFVIDRNGRVDTRIEGAFSVAELDDAVARVAG
jgi:hypothetical protein